MAAFDIVINNTDRKGGHCLRAADGSIFGIDHGVSFHAQWKLRTVIWDFGGEPIPPDVCADLHRLSRTAAGRLRDRLEPLLDRFELDAVRARIEHLLAPASPRSRRRLPLLPLAHDLTRYSVSSSSARTVSISRSMYSSISCRVHRGAGGLLAVVFLGTHGRPRFGGRRLGESLVERRDRAARAAPVAGAPRRSPAGHSARMRWERSRTLPPWG